MGSVVSFLGTGVKMLIRAYADGRIEERPFEEGSGVPERSRSPVSAKAFDHWQTERWKAKTSAPIGLREDGTPFTEEDIQAILEVLENVSGEREA